MKIAALQMDIAWHDRDENFRKVREYALRARDQQAGLLVLPEMFATGFSMDTNVTAEKIDGRTPAFLRSLASETDMALVGGFVLESGEAAGPRNVSLAVDGKGRDLALYSKIHQIGLLEEDIHYAPGTDPVTFGIEGIGTACFICYDLRFPELFRAVVDDCELIMVIASWPALRQSHWDILLRARAVESQCYMVGVNRIGEGGGSQFRGGSAIIDPLGELLAFGGDEEGLLIAGIEKNRVEDIRASMPFLKDRRPGLLSGRQR